MENVRKLAASARLPILAVSNNASEMALRKGMGLLADDHKLRFERSAMLESIARLARAVGDPMAADPDTMNDAAMNHYKTGELVNA
jgi:hypothetical protein